jgi:hypothetical protein
LLSINPRIMCRWKKLTILAILPPDFVFLRILSLRRVFFRESVHDQIVAVC